jgi:tripartite-type tricarboxylate transporter receptor subunit TctC
MRPSPLSRRAVVALAAACALGAAAPAARAQGGKVTRIVVAFPPGGPVDFVARALSEKLGRELGEQVIVENRAGANGALAADFTVRAPADGRTLWLTSVGAVAINLSLYEKLSYDPARDLAPVSLVVSNVEVLVVGPKTAAPTAREFVDAAKQGGAPLTLASSGSGSVPHLAAELFRDASGAPVSHIPYKGAAPAINDVMAGHVDGFFGDIAGVINFIKAGKLRPIGIAAPVRSPLLPEVKTFQEMGMAGVDSDNWYGLFAPAKTPRADLDRIAQALKRTLADPAVADRLAASGSTPHWSSPAELTALLQKDTAKWGAVVRAKRIKAD